MPPPRSSRSSRSLAVYMAGKVVRHARNMKNIFEQKMTCRDCKLLPNNPVTGRCGHTRCTMCIEKNGACPCGMRQPGTLHTNILVRDVVEKIRCRHQHSLIRYRRMSSVNSLNSNNSELRLIPSTSSGRIQKYAQRRRLQRSQPRGRITTLSNDMPLRSVAASLPIPNGYTTELISSGRYHDAVAHLAHMAAASNAMSHLATNLLTKVITILNPERDPAGLMRTLYHSIRLQSSTTMVDYSSIECPICYNVMVQPLTTTCGHTFCRSCIKRCMQDRDVCPLCSSSLRSFYPTMTEDTEFVHALASTMTNLSLSELEFIPIFTCTVAYPSLPCPLMIFDSDFQNVVRGILDSGSRKFGMLASLSDSSRYAKYGTIVEVRDCIVFEDGKFILTTVGTSRFRVLEKVVMNGCPFARVQEHNDVIPTGEAHIFNLQLLAEQIRVRVGEWLPSLEMAIRTDMSTCFGAFPDMNAEGEWWRNPNGPGWLWWLIAVLPLRVEIQVLMVSTKSLGKRMTAVLRTLDAMEYYKYVYTML